jgi:hypothetical protein
MFVHLVFHNAYEHIGYYGEARITGTQECSSDKPKAQASSSSHYSCVAYHEKVYQTFFFATVMKKIGITYLGEYFITVYSVILVFSVCKKWNNIRYP